MSAAIETEGLTKTYGKSRGIWEVDLTVDQGEVFGFLGPNGAGKTTTIRTLLGFLRPTGGRARVFGMDVRRQSVDIRARVGNLPGEFALEDRMSGEELLRFFARLRGVEDLDQEEFLEIIDEVKAEGRTVFFSSHVLSEVERVCDRVGIIRGGRLDRKSVV